MQIVKDTTPAVNPQTESLADAFNAKEGIKLNPTPRGGEPTEIHVRPLYVDQLIPIIERVESIFDLLKSMANESGDVNLLDVFKAGKEDVLELLAAAVERDRTGFIGRLELDDLLELFAAVVKVNKDFFEQNVRGRLDQVMSQLGSML